MAKAKEECERADGKNLSTVDENNLVKGNKASRIRETLNYRLRATGAKTLHVRDRFMVDGS